VRRRLTITGVLVALAAATAWANWNDTSTGVDLDKLRRFPLTKVRAGLIREATQVVFDGITARQASDGLREVTLRGKGKSGRRWQVRIASIDEVWRGDLDGNGTQDYVLIGPGPYFNGRMTPLYSTSILLMDGDGMPVPFFEALFHNEKGEGFRNIVDLDGDGRAEWLVSSYDEQASDPRVGGICSGHWVTRSFRFRNAGIEEVRATMGEIAFPFVQNWSYRPSECIDLGENSGITVQPPFMEKSMGDSNGTIRGSGSEIRFVPKSPVNGCKKIHLELFTEIIVYDRPVLREIVFPTLFSSYPDDLRKRIQRVNARVEARDIRNRFGDGNCFPESVWAK